MFARTPRLLLRPGWREDAPALHAAIDESVVRNTSRMPSPYRLSDAEDFLAPPARASYPTLLIFERTERAPGLVGGISLMPDADDPAAVEIGYWITPAAQGRGFATEAGRAVLAMAHALGRRRLVAAHFIDNPGSGRVLAKLGFVRTGRVTARYSRARDGLVPTALYVRDADAVSSGDASLAA